MAAIDTLVMLIALGSRGEPLAPPFVMAEPVSQETCQIMRKDPALLEGLTARAKELDPKAARGVIACQTLDRDHARTLGKELLDGNP